MLNSAKGRQGDEALIRTKDGGAVHKAVMVAEILSMAQAGGATEGNYSGHSLRVTGAQRMAAAGIPLEKIKVFGRWASNQALRDTRDALISQMYLGTAHRVESQVGMLAPVATTKAAATKSASN